MKRKISAIIASFKNGAKRRAENRLLKSFYAGGKIPWSPGYDLYKTEEIKKSLSPSTLQSFSNRLMPSSSYGLGLDERIVEYPWLFSRLSNQENSKILDAGSTLNFEYLVEHNLVKGKDLHIYTYYPEKSAFWKKRISYTFGDLRHLPYRDNWFDEIVCQSTLEHIDMDNSLYGYSNKEDKNLIGKSYDFLKAVDQLYRILKPNGRMLLTFPFGRFENHGFFQQFDSEMLDKLLGTLKPSSKRVEMTFFRYTIDGWIFSDQSDCEDCQSFDPKTGKTDLKDGAAHSRCVCCILIDKI